MKVTVIGTGYVGLVTGVCLAEVGNDVLCLDVDKRKIEILNSGGVPIYEPGLEDLIKQNVAKGRLRFTTDIEVSVAHGDVQFIAVGTPPDEDGSADLQYVLAAARNIGKYATNHKIIVDKSTVPVGTAEKVQAAIADELAKRYQQDLTFDVVSNPEFLKEGAAIEDCMRPDRIVLGVASDASVALDTMRQLYAPFNRNHDRIIVMDVRSAEFTKYTANAMLATRISFMNELALLAEKTGVDIEAVRRGIGSDPRIGYHFLYAGCGYGGSCFPKDVQALIRTADDYGQPLSILRAVESANERQKHVLVDKAVEYYDGDINGKTFGIWGLAFKPGTDDMREAPSRTIIKELIDRGAYIYAYDPVATEEAKRSLSLLLSKADMRRIHFCDMAYQATIKVDALFIVTDWKEFKTPNFRNFHENMNSPVIFDGRNLFDPRQMIEEGIIYKPIGR
jgi:UDPglucose 6-dehydrogenase